MPDDCVSTLQAGAQLLRVHFAYPGAQRLLSHPAFESVEDAGDADILWHSTPTSNFLGIPTCVFLQKKPFFPLPLHHRHIHNTGQAEALPEQCVSTKQSNLQHSLTNVIVTCVSCLHHPE